ncbi:hypothetical protein ACFL4G_05870 [Thermodesulfobacteriota bacterium]
MERKRVPEYLWIKIKSPPNALDPEEQARTEKLSDELKKHLEAGRFVDVIDENDKVIAHIRLIGGRLVLRDPESSVSLEVK